MKNRLLLLPVLLVLLAVGLWFLLSGGEDRGGAGRGEISLPGTPAAPALDEEEPAPELTRADEPREAPAPERTTPVRTEAAPVAAAPVDVDYTSFDLEDARWVEVTVLRPAGAPAEPDLRLLALASTGEDVVDGEDLQSELDLSDGFLEEFEDEDGIARRLVGNGPVRMPLPEGCTSAIFLLQSRYLFLEPVIVSAADLGTTRTLEPTLGAWVTGRLDVPPLAIERGLTADDIDLEFSGRPTSEGMRGFRNQHEREVHVREDFTFELAAVPADRTYAVGAECDDLVRYMDLSRTFEAGVPNEVVIELQLGAIVRGRVTGGGEPLGEARVEVGGRRNGFMFSGGNQEGVEDDGTYELRGVSPGTVKVSAECEGWLDSEELSLELTDGQIYEGADFDLASGNRIVGRVVWPDGSPAAGVTVSGKERAQMGWQQDRGDTRTEEDGTFRLSGLGEDPLNLVASGKPSEELCEKLGVPFEALGTETDQFARLAELGYVSEDEHTVDASSKKKKAPTWKAIAKGVTPGTGDVLITLEPPVLIPGRVVDGGGKPVESFSIEVNTPSQRRFSWFSTDQEFTDPDGGFSVAIAHEGDWTLKAKADGFDDSEDQTVTVPYVGQPLEFTLTRSVGVSGLVVDPTGAPVPGAEVQISRGDPSERFMFGGNDEETTDEDGAFTFDEVSASGVTLVASHEDWAKSEPWLVEAAPGETLEGIVLSLRVGARITGEVYGDDGEPQVGRTVTAGSGAESFGPFGGGDNQTVTDASGRFVLEGVDPGKITVSATPSEEDMMEAMSGDDEDGQAAMMNLMGSILSETVEVADGGEAHVILGAEPKRPVRIYGKVLDAGSPVAEASVFVVSEGSSLFQGMKIAAVEGGSYEVTVDRPGDYTLSVNTNGFQGGMGISFNCEVPDADELEMDLLLPTGRITGRVLGPQGEPVEGMSLRIETGGGFMGLEDLDQSKNSVTNAEGGFAFERLRAGRYSLSVGSGASFFGNNNEAYGGKVVTGLELEEGQALLGVDIRLERSGKLSGMVKDKDGNPLSGAAVFARDESGNVLSGITSTVSDAGGRFTYDGLPPGRITVFARSDTHASTDSAPIEIASGQTAEVELTLDVGTFVKVSLLEDGEPVRARLQILDQDGRQVNGMNSTMQLQSMMMEGFSSRERRVGPLPPGTYTLIATAPSGEDAKKKLKIQAGQKERAVKLRLR